MSEVKKDFKVEAFHAAIPTAEVWIDTASDYANKILNDPNVGASNGSREEALKTLTRIAEKCASLSEKVQKMK